MSDPDLSADPCEKLAFAADLQRQAQDHTRRAAQIGTSLVGKLFDRSNQLLDRFQAPIVAINRSLQTRARQIQGGISRRNNRLRGQINQALINTSYRISQTVGGLRGRLNANLTPSGAPPVSFPGFQPVPSGKTAEIQGEPGGLFIRTPAQRGFVQGMPQGVPQGMGVASAELPTGIVPEFGVGLPAASPPLPPIHPITGESGGGQAGAGTYGPIPGLQGIAPEQIPPPGIDPSLAWAVREICNCLRRSATASHDPVDLDQPNAFLFAQKSEDWHNFMEQWYGPFMTEIVDAGSMDELMLPIYRIPPLYG